MVLSVGACKQEWMYQASNRSTTGAYYRHIYLAESLFHLKSGRQVSYLDENSALGEEYEPRCLHWMMMLLSSHRSFYQMSGLILSRSLSLTLSGTLFWAIGIWRPEKWYCQKEKKKKSLKFCLYVIISIKDKCSLKQTLSTK